MVTVSAVSCQWHRLSMAFYQVSRVLKGVVALQSEVVYPGLPDEAISDTM